MTIVDPDAAPMIRTRTEPRRSGLWAPLPLAAGLVLLGLLWAAPVPLLAETSFSAHMVQHMGLVAVAAPLLAFGLLRLRPEIADAIPPGLAIAASVAEFATVWSWHSPALHDGARADGLLRIAEQGSFLVIGLAVWIAAIGSAQGDAGRAGRAGGILALLLTSMHMTLLGALLLFAPRALYDLALCSPTAGMSAVEDQALGGAIMLTVGGLSYLAGGVGLAASILAAEPFAAVRSAGPIGATGPAEATP